MKIEWDASRNLFNLFDGTTLITSVSLAYLQSEWGFLQGIEFLVKVRS